MLKKINILFSSLLLTISLDAREPILAILTSANSNETQSFNISNFNLTCKPYGILTIERLYAISDEKSDEGLICREKIKSIYIKNPNLQYFAQLLLKRQQRYHIVPKKEGECVLYAKGQMTLSELLLAEGLALVKPLFNDEEFKDDFNAAQRKARLNKKGLWAEEIYEMCAAKLYE